MADDEENLAEFRNLFKALELTINQNGGNQNIDQFADSLMRFLDSSVEANVEASAPVTFRENVSSISQGHLSFTEFKARSSLSEKQLNHLLKVKVLNLKSGKIYYKKIWIIPPKLAATFLSLLGFLLCFVATNIIFRQFLGTWIWPLCYLFGFSIGMGVVNVIDRSFKIYEPLNILETYLPWIPKQHFG